MAQQRQAPTYLNRRQAQRFAAVLTCQFDVMRTPPILETQCQLLL